LKTINIQIQVPEDISESDERKVYLKAKETVILELFKSGIISTRKAAEELGMALYDFLDFLNEKGIPVVRDGINSEALQKFRTQTGREKASSE
jgi:predicted HTH domain antitoxin